MDAKDEISDRRRLAALEATALLDTPTERVFDRLTEMAAVTLGVPIALISLVTDDRQFFKSQCGLPAPVATARETPLSHSFCQHVVQDRAPLVIEDARENARVRDNLAIPDLGAIAYAGVPLTLPDGQVIGSFCAIDTSPHRWREADIELLNTLAETTM
jgi:GAF domain-containing protein